MDERHLSKTRDGEKGIKAASSIWCCSREVKAHKSLSPGQHHHHRGPAACWAQHGPRGLRGGWRGKEIHIHEGIDQLPLLQ